jgi:hypothetical protein
VRVLEGSLARALIDIDPMPTLLIPARNPRRRKRGTLLLLLLVRRPLALTLALVLVREIARHVLDEVHLASLESAKWPG